ncbi:MAG TPA: energy transducer TonB [Lacunisphaera sp.]|jgi:protein TonB|nr:energy transducer TonB [Lacunisphaera sp.]
MMLRLFIALSVALAVTLFAGCAAASTSAPARIERHVAFTGSYFKIKDVDVKPVVKAMQQPVFPPQFRRPGVSGEVLIDFIIDENGKTTQIQCAAATDEAFATAAVEAVRNWRFTPARKGGRPVACAVEQSLSFSID